MNSVSKTTTKRVPWNKGKTGIYSEETLRKMSIAASTRTGRVPWNKGKTLSAEHRAKISKTLTGENNPMNRQGVRARHKAAVNNPKTRAKRSESLKKLWEDPKYREKQTERMRGKNNPFFDKTHSEEAKTKQRIATIERMKDPKARKELSAARAGEKNPFFGKTHSEETKRMMSENNAMKRSEERAKISGKNCHLWRGGISFEPYCPQFNFDLKERIRNRDGRICQLCGKSEIQNGQRLAVHHINGDKMQGCDNKKWALVALCHSCNAKSDTLEKEFLIVSNLKRGGD